MKHDKGKPATAGVGVMSGRVSAYQNTATTRSSEERDRLILENLPQVRLIARRIHEKLPESVSLDDLVSNGVVGLITAVDNFDPSQGVKLKTYAEYKIRGAILDSLRGLDWAPRQKRKKAKQIAVNFDGVRREVKSASEQRRNARPERRQAPRRNMSTTGWIRLDGGFATRECKIVDLSTAGVRLAIPFAGKIPETFTLLFAKRAQGHRVRVIWRRANQIGVKFI